MPIRSRNDATNLVKRHVPIGSQLVTVCYIHGEHPALLGVVACTPHRWTGLVRSPWAPCFRSSLDRCFSSAIIISDSGASTAAASSHDVLVARIMAGFGNLHGYLYRWSTGDRN
jgi:hypothetical protein